MDEREKNPQENGEPGRSILSSPPQTGEVDEEMRAIRESLFNPKDSFDYYLANPPSRPKCEIAQYVESQGIRIPRIFGSFEEALSSSRPFIIRSEHPQEYAGASGILESYTVSDGQREYARRVTPMHTDQFSGSLWERFQRRKGSYLDFSRLLAAHLDQPRGREFEKDLPSLRYDRIRNYCELLGISPEQFAKQTSYSYWEKLGGYNRAIVADSAIPDRYHIFTSRNSQNSYHNYTVVDRGKKTGNLPHPLPPELEADIEGTIAFYETIRDLPRFSRAHCPLIEFQTDGGVHYFLQCHRTRDRTLSTWELTREREPDEIKAIFVRGATPPEGIEVRVSFYSPLTRFAVREEEAGCDFHQNHVFSEVMSRVRRVQLIPYDDFHHFAFETAVGHAPKSKIFKPKLSVVIDQNLQALGLPEVPDDLRVEDEGEIPPPSLPMRIVSDGKTAYVKFLLQSGI